MDGMDGLGSDSAAVVLDDRHLEVWRDHLCDRLLDADAPWSAGQQLDVALAVVARGDLVALNLASGHSGPALARDRRRIAASRGPAMLGLTVVTAGRAELELEGTTLELGAGDVCLLASHSRFRKRVGAGYAESFLYCPLATAEATVGPTARALTPGVAARTPLLAVLADTLRSIGRHAAHLDAADWQPLVGSVMSLTAAAFAPRPPADDTVTSAADVARRARIDRHIDAHLADPTLSPPTLAAAVHISLRYLHRLFEGRGASVAATILARRLDRARALLHDRAWRHRPIADIARAVGLPRADHFSRAFRARFGVPPRAVRALRGERANRSGSASAG